MWRTSAVHTQETGNLKYICICWIHLGNELRYSFITLSFIANTWQHCFERQSVVSSEVSQYHIKTNYKHKILIEACQNFNFLIWNFCKTCLDCFNCLTLWNNTNINSETFCRNVYFLKLYSNRSANINPINQTINLQVVIKKMIHSSAF